jgi:hypothetical protein
MYSYEVHDRISDYLREVIGPRLAELHQVPLETEWVHYFRARQRSGNRRLFVVASHFVVSILAPLLTWIMAPDAVPLSVVLLLAAAYIASGFWLISKNRKWREKGIIPARSKAKDA